MISIDRFVEHIFECLRLSIGGDFTYEEQISQLHYLLYGVIQKLSTIEENLLSVIEVGKFLYKKKK